MNCELRLYLDRLDAQSAPLVLHAVMARALYVVDGSLAVREDDQPSTAMTLSGNSASSAAGEHAIAAAGASAQVLRWELTNNEQQAQPDKSDPLSELLIAAPMTLDAGQDYLLRCDRVDFPPGGQALTHTHQGGGIRCLLFGSIRIDTHGSSRQYGPLQAWFEAGPESVFASTQADAPSAFARVMVLPRGLLGGKSSIKYVNAEDAAKPKSQRYQIFIDQPIDLAS